MAGDSRWNVVVVGAGITGLATAWFLAQRGIKRIAVVSDPECPPATLASAGRIMGGQTDNYTRVSHAHGDEFARKLWQFGDAAFDRIVAFAQSFGVPVATGRRLRLITSPEEHTEAQKAVVQLCAAGFTATLAPVNESQWGESMLSRVLAIQDEGPRGGTINTVGLLAALRQASGVTHETHSIHGLRAAAGHMELTHARGTLTCEIVVLANHLHIANFVPELGEALVPYADQWHVGTGLRTGSWSAPGVCFSLNHGYEWGVTGLDSTLALGGGRFLRPLAGIGATLAQADSKASHYLQKQLVKTFDWGKSVTLGTARPLRECWPCDELPVIGPMFGESRILIATGFMGAGLTMGFQAGYCLAEMIATGRAPELADRLWPHRLRSLA